MSATAAPEFDLGEGSLAADAFEAQFAAEDADFALDHLTALIIDAERARAAVIIQLSYVNEDLAYFRSGAASPTSWLRRSTIASASESASIVRLANLLRRLPALRDALEAEATTIAHIEALQAVATTRRNEALDDFAERLTEYAQTLNLDDFSAVCQHWASLADEHDAPPPGSDDHFVRFTPTLFGDVRLAGNLSAEVAASIREALNTRNGPDRADAPIRRSVGQRNHDALGDISDEYLTRTTTGSATEAGPARKPRPTGIVLVDFDTFTQTYEDVDLDSIRRDLLNTGPIPSRTAQLMTCDADIQRLVIDPHGQPLNLGRATPTITSSQRRALTVRDGGCVFPTCERPAQWCDAHHIHERQHNGPSDLDNLVLLCRHHHRAVHGYDWTIERDPVTGQVKVIRRDGVIYQRGPDGTVKPEMPPNHPPDWR
jgi:hypothetical protein